MPIKNYGVIKGRAIDRKMGKGDTPHYQIHLLSGNHHYRVAVNVKSQSAPSDVLCYFNEHFDHPVLPKLESLPQEYTALESQPGGAALDYIRSNLFDFDEMKPLAYHIAGPFNDLNERLDRFVQRAMATEDALVYAFGSRWGPDQTADPYFGFQPGDGIHDIHMNQGNSPHWQRDDGVWQDGALLFHFPSKQQWVAVFTSFQSQSFYTDDQTGHALDVIPKEKGAVKIIAVLATKEKQTATLINRSSAPVDLKEWALLNSVRVKKTLNEEISPGECLKIDLEDGYLSESGGLLTLVDAKGLKIDGIAYTKQDSAHQGWTTVF